MKIYKTCLEGIFLFHGFLHSRQRRLAEQTSHFTMSKLTKRRPSKELYHKQHIILYNGDLSRELSSSVPPAFPKGTTCRQKFFFPAELVIPLVLQLNSPQKCSNCCRKRLLLTLVRRNNYRFLANRPRRIRRVSDSFHPIRRQHQHSRVLRTLSRQYGAVRRSRCLIRGLKHANETVTKPECYLQAVISKTTM